jgi:DNA-binding NtrC family response regulator
MPHTVMVVEDSLELRESLADFLVEAGYDAVVAESAERALELLNTVARPCLVLLDYRMAGVGADGFAEALESMADAHEFKLILMSGMQGVRLRTDRRVVHTLMKPFDLEVLRALLVRYCGRPIKPAPVVGA